MRGVVLGAGLSALLVWVGRSRVAVLFPKIAIYAVLGLAEIAVVHNDLFRAMAGLPQGTDVLVAATDFRV